MVQVLLTHVPEGGSQRPPTCISSQDSEDMRPLDVALATQQWPAVRLLIAAGALQACPELTRAQQELQQLLLLPDSRRQSGALVFLVSFPQKASTVLRQQYSHIRPWVLWYLHHLHLWTKGLRACCKLQSTCAATAVRILSMA